jgi:glycerol-3-phosphate cytidylyltransferase
MNIVYTAGCFDLFHYGHLNILQQAKKLGDYLIVAVSSSKLMKEKRKVEIIPFKQRVKLLQALKCVDQVVEEKKIFDIKQFKKLKADIFVIGDDWKNRTDIPNLTWLKKHKKIIFIPYTKSLSTSKIEQKIIKNSYKIIKSQVKRTCPK